MVKNASAEIDAGHGETNLSSAIRVFVLRSLAREPLGSL
jgi:predicted DNA-binding ribbon-helix-helix protein